MRKSIWKEMGFVVQPRPSTAELCCMAKEINAREASIFTPDMTQQLMEERRRDERMEAEQAIREERQLAQSDHYGWADFHRDGLGML